MRLWKQENKKFEAIIATGERTPKADFELPTEYIERISEELRLQGLLPEQQLAINALTSLSKLDEIEQQITDPYPDNIVDLKNGRIDEAALTKALHNNDWQRLRTYQAQRAALKFEISEAHGDDESKWPSDDPDVIKYRITIGDIDLSMEPTLKDALHYYIRESRIRPRNKEQQNKLEEDTRRNVAKIAEYLPQKIDTKLSSLHKHELKLREVCVKLWPKASTRTRNAGSCRTVIRRWNKQTNVETAPNPFEAIVADATQLIDTDRTERRSASSAEFKETWKKLIVEPDQEVRLLGLLYLYCGLPAREAKGLLRDDIKTKASPPHLIIRQNRLRLLGKGRIDRLVPLVEPMLSVVKEYVKSWEGNHGDDPLFLKLRTQTSSETAKMLRRYLVNLNPDDHRLYDMYSFRHSFKERCVAADADERHIKYLFGHSDPYTVQLRNMTLDRHYSDRTATTNLIEELKDTMDRIMKLDDFGYKEESDLN